MNKAPVISLVLNAHTPFVRHPELTNSPEERWFFESLCETYLPLLQVFDRLDADHIPFRMGISLSPVLCHLLSDELLLARCLDYMDKRIEFGLRELDRTAGEPELRTLAQFYYDQLVDRRITFTERYGKNILKIFEYYQKKGRVEILTTAATYGFLPFYTAYPEAVQAQLEVAVASYRYHFGRYPQGFWLPELGWSAELEEYLRAYNFGYTFVDTHALVFAEPGARRGSFYPVKTPLGILILARDYYAAEALTHRDRGFIRDRIYREYYEDAGYELPPEQLRSFLGIRGCRNPTGYKYRASPEGGAQRPVYDPQGAAEKAAEQARSFLDGRIQSLSAAGALMDEPAISLCAFDADTFGRVWYEGCHFLEAFFREGAKRKDLQFMTPSEYLYKQDVVSLQTVVPEFSSWGVNGYAETWLDSSNDWMYRHTIRSLERMIELAERFPDDSGLKERALNQAAREILLALSSDWSKMLYRQESAEYARNQIEGSLRNFTTIYEALGSNYISTEWLTGLEKRHNLFPSINYRVFRRKK
jgi:1,4-alpha-glucan branching enzyme